MSISILNRGASGGLKPELIVTAPAGSTIDLLQGGIIIDTYTLGLSETAHVFVVKMGSYTVTGTLGTDTNSVDVIVDSVKQYGVIIGYWYGMTTTFPSADSSWVIEGGTFSYSTNFTYPGLYQASATKIGTIMDAVNSSDYTKRVTMPICLNEFTGYLKTNLYSSSTNRMGGIIIAFLDENKVERLRVNHTDDWSGSYGQALRLYTSEDGITWSQKSPTFNDNSSPQNYRTGQSVENNIQYQDGVFTCTTKYYTSSSATTTATQSFEVDLPIIHYARVIFKSYSTYYCPRMNLAQLTLTPI